jgi:hypothetical protein
MATGFRLSALSIVLALLCLSRPASAERSRDALRTAFMEMNQKHQELVRSHPEVYGNYPVVELVTMGIGSLIWERHGHIALCIRYQDPQQDTCYNYGIGDFHEPVKMGTGFFRGTKSFWVGPQDPQQMFSIYLFADRTIWVQPLPLTDAQEQTVISKLEYDIQEDHKHYAYDHFWDNCTTRVRDVLDGAIGGELKKFAATQKTDGRTYRDLAREGFFGMRLALLITDMAMGRETDREPTYWDRMFLPDYMRDAAAAFWKIQPFEVYQRKGPPSLKDGPSGRFLFTLVILLLTAPAWATRLWGRFQRTGLVLSVAPYVFLGSIFWFLAIISPLPYVNTNESCLVLLPTDILLFSILRPARRRLYARIRVGMLGLCLLLMLVGVLKQPIWPLLFWPLVPSLVVGFWPQSQKSDEKK